MSLRTLWNIYQLSLMRRFSSDGLVIVLPYASTTLPNQFVADSNKSSSKTSTGNVIVPIANISSCCFRFVWLLLYAPSLAQWLELGAPYLASSLLAFSKPMPYCLSRVLVLARFHELFYSKEDFVKPARHRIDGVGLAAKARAGTAPELGREG